MKILNDHANDRHATAESSDQNELSEIQKDLYETITTSSSQCTFDLEINPYNKDFDSETKSAEQETAAQK